MRKLLQMLLVRHKRSHWHAASQCFAQTQVVGLNSEMLKGKWASGSSKPTLYFIEHQMRSRLRAFIPDGTQPFRVGNANSGVPLNGFHDDAGHGSIDGLKAFHVIPRNQFYVADKGSEWRFAFGI